MCSRLVGGPFWQPSPSIPSNTASRYALFTAQQQAVPFLVLTLDLPPAPLFQDEMEKNIIPQVPLTSLLSKYDGVTAQVGEMCSVPGFVGLLGLPFFFMFQDTGPTRKRFSITRLPKYLIFHIKRFTKNNFTLEKNPTIVNFPIKSLDMAECECLVRCPISP
jgi:U4/U6.U5 tri-snRNP-associated protein 2